MPARKDLNSAPPTAIKGEVCREGCDSEGTEFESLDHFGPFFCYDFDLFDLFDL